MLYMSHSGPFVACCSAPQRGLDTKPSEKCINQCSNFLSALARLAKAMYLQLAQDFSLTMHSLHDAPVRCADGIAMKAWHVVSFIETCIYQGVTDVLLFSFLQASTSVPSRCRSRVQGTSFFRMGLDAQPALSASMGLNESDSTRVQHGCCT
jgi:hypothetical protein